MSMRARSGLSQAQLKLEQSLRGHSVLRLGKGPFRVEMTKKLGLPVFLALSLCAKAEVRVFVEGSNGGACIKYECTAGEVVRAFALDVSVDRGQITGITNFFRGESVAEATGYGIFPASLRDHITVGTGTNINWDVSEYTPLAVAADAPNGTLPGLNSSGVTLELGALWDPTDPEAMPGPAGILCVLKLSHGAKVSVAPNASRGGVVSAIPGSVISTVFTGAPVGPVVTSASVASGIMTILFQGGELQMSTSLPGQWTNTGDASGTYSEPIQTNQMKFYRVRSL